MKGKKTKKAGKSGKKISFTKSIGKLITISENTKKVDVIVMFGMMAALSDAFKPYAGKPMKTDDICEECFGKNVDLSLCLLDKENGEPVIYCFN